MTTSCVLLNHAHAATNLNKLQVAQDTLAMVMCSVSATELHRQLHWWPIHQQITYKIAIINKKAQLSLTNPHDAKACQKLLQFDVLTTLSLIILVYLHSFSCCCVRNLQNPAKFSENSNL